MAKEKGYRPPYKYVEVIWDDAASNSQTWVAIADVEHPEQVITRGWVVKEEKSFVCIASSVANNEDHEDTVGNTMTIPTGMIVSRREINAVTVKPRAPRKAKPKVEAPNADH